MRKKTNAAVPVKKKETISVQDGSIIIPIAFAVARYGGKVSSAEGERSGGITRTELAIIDAVLHKIQALVRKRIDMQSSGIPEDPQLVLRFEEEAGKITDPSQSKVTDVGNYEFRFPLRDLGIAPRHYQEAFDTVMKMGDINVEWEFDDERHGRSTTKKQLFQPTAFGAVKRWNDPESHRNSKGQVEQVPANTPNNLFHWEYTGKPAVGISMSGIVADRLFDPYRYGHYLDITLDFKCKYSIRLYWFLSLYWSRGFTRFDFSWEALRTTLGIDQNPEGGKNIIQELPDSHTVRITAPDVTRIVTGVYPKLSLFTARVLNPIREDFLRMAPKPAADGGETAAPPRVEYNLSYEVVKRVDTSRNTRVEVADRIIILLDVSSLGRQIQEGRDVNAQQRRIINKMTEQLFQQQDKALYFARSAAGQLQALEDKVDYIVEGIRSRNAQWDVCQRLNEIDAAFNSDMQSATTDGRRKNVMKRHDTEVRSAIQGYARRSIENFCKTELSRQPGPAQDEDAKGTRVAQAATGAGPAASATRQIRHSATGTLTDGDMESFARLKSELRTAAVRRYAEWAERAVEGMELVCVDGIQGKIRLRSMGTNLSLCVPEYWGDERFSGCVGTCFPGYGWEEV